jgi:hypothetical protein
MNIVTRICCDGGRWIDVGTSVYIIPCRGARLTDLHEYRAFLSSNHDVYRNVVCLNEKEAIRYIKSQMGFVNWVFTYFTL